MADGRHRLQTCDMRFQLLALVPLAILAQACGGPAAAVYSPTTHDAKERAARPPSSVELYLAPDEPRCKYHYVGIYDARPPKGWVGNIEDNPKAARDAMVEDAASRGLDGIADVRCASAGTVRYGFCEGKAFVCE